METTRLKRLSRTTGALAVLAVGASLTAVPQASAADTPTQKQLLEACDFADLCQFNPQSYSAYQGPRHQVGSTLYNCGTEVNEQKIGWADTTGTTNTVGIAVTATASFWKSYEVAVEASYSHSWETSHTETEETTVRAPAGHKAWINHGPAKQRAKGWYEIHFGKRYYGHYIWYVNNFESYGWDKDHSGYTAVSNQPMTQAERGAHCR